MIATGQFSVAKVRDGAKGDKGDKGDNGISIVGVSREYTASTSYNELINPDWADSHTPEWSVTEPSIDATHYLWERVKTTLSDGNVTYSDAICQRMISGIISDVDNVKGQITDKVWQSDITTSINSYDSSTVSTIRDRVTTTEQNISGITTRVSDVESTTGSLGTRLTSAESSITQNAENIELKVAKDGVISAINQSAESITISADKVNIAGSTSFTSLSNQVTAIQNKADKNADIIANWATDATSATTTINGGLIQTHTIESTHLATDAIMSNNFQASQNVNSPYSVAGSFLDLTNGNFYTPNFGLDNVNGNAYFNGEITATSGQIGDDTSNHWQIGTVVDFNGNQSAAIESNGTSYIQSGDWMISNNRIDTRHYDNQRKYTYLYEDGVYWDFGLHTPSLTSDNAYENNFIYIRNHESTIPTLEGAWNYVFRVDRNGMIYINGVSLDNKYASIDGVSGAYLPMTGGNLTGNLSVGGNLSVTGTITGLKTLSVNGKTYNGTEAVNVGTIGAAYGGTGQTSLVNSADALINALPEGTGTPTDNMYYIGQKEDGTTNVYYRKPVTTLWTYIKSKITADASFLDTVYVPKTGGEFTGAVTVSDIFTAGEIVTENLTANGTGHFTNGVYGDLTSNYSFISTLQADEVTVGNLIVNGVARFNNGLYGDITGKINGYTIAKDVPASALFTDTTYTFRGGTNEFTVTPKNGDAQTVSITPFIADASNSSSGLMSASDKTTLDNIAANFSGGTITISNVTASNGLTYNYDSATGITAITGTYPITTSTGTEGQVLIADSNGKGAWNDQDNLTIKKLDNKYDNISASRPTTANIAPSSDRIGSLEVFKVTSAMTEGKPTNNGHILHMNWDNTAGYDSQLYIPITSVTNYHPQWRTMNKGTWTDWVFFLDENNFNSYAPTLTGTGASGTWGIDISGNANTASTANTATRANQDGNGNVIVDTYVTLSTNQTISSTKTFSAMPVASAGLCVGNSGTAGGLSLWNDKDIKHYGLALRTTADSGKHGYVQGDYATYNYMYAASASALPTRGWIFKDSVNDKGVASISGAGNAVFNGSITVGGNETNTLGCRQEFNEDLQCLEFIFN